MKNISILVITLAALGCASSSKDRSVSNASSNPDIAQTSSPSSGGVSCSQEVALDCPNGIDGCAKNQTTVHVCVSTTAQAGPSCAQEIALECPAGEVDACLLTPAPSAQHLCVRR
jgi:hypothetical protein